MYLIDNLLYYMRYFVTVGIFCNGCLWILSIFVNFGQLLAHLIQFRSDSLEVTHR